MRKIIRIRRVPKLGASEEEIFIETLKRAAEERAMYETDQIMTLKNALFRQASLSTPATL
tara:strand:- start:488 stop:667 length:180 start_codon:yes stop_codon:yes gene_type:complete